MTANATRIRSAGYRVGNLCIVTGIGTTAKDIGSGASLDVWNIPKSATQFECAFSMYGYQKTRAYTSGTNLRIWNDTGSVIPSGATFVFSAVYIAAS